VSDRLTGPRRPSQNNVAAPARQSASAQFPPLLSIEEWKTLFSKLDTSFDELEERTRYRAYEPYEQRGKRDGYAIEDWLQG
jgi:Protein of unknown function (DUF2934)